MLASEAPEGTEEGSKRLRDGPGGRIPTMNNENHSNVFMDEGPSGSGKPGHAVSHSRQVPGGQTEDRFGPIGSEKANGGIIHDSG